jgi:acyl-CoA synthetase (NDP forming)
MSVAEPRPAAAGLRRFLRPRSVAVVGASERQARSNNAVESMREAGMELYFVNPNRPEVYGEAAYPELRAIPHPVDAVLSIVGAEAAVGVVAEAREIDAGGVVVIAGGFSEAGPQGAELERALLEAAGDLPVLGPNCNGFVRPAEGARLSGAPRLPFPAGGIGVVTHSGALLGVFGLAAQERGVGYSSLISTGNEMALDMADCLEFLVDDEETRVIALVVETIRAPERFFAAARRAREAGKPIVALKLGRSERGSEIATSHTGALTGEAWVYDAAFRQHGIGIAADIVDLLDRASLVAQLPAERWSAVRGLAVMSLSGGWSALAGDVAAQEGIELPPLLDLRESINAILPERVTVNPLDMTGFAMGRADVVEGLLEIYGASDDVDAIMVQWFLDETAQAPGQAFIEAAVAAADRLGKPVIIGSIEDGHLGDWARALPAQGVGTGRGLRATLRGLRTMADVVRHAEQPHDQPPPAPAASPLDAQHVVSSSAGPMLSFGATMDLMAGAGIPVAPYHLVGGGDDTTALTVPFDGPYVVKLADVPHRTELGAVRLDVSADALATVVTQLRGLALRELLPPSVVVQPQVPLDAEAFVGVQAEGGLGPLVVCGVGGILVELLGRVAGRLAPLSPAEADALLEELADTGVFEGHRGGRPWDREGLREILVAAGRLARATAPWLKTLDINPLGLGPDGFVALDGLCLVEPHRP